MPRLSEVEKRERKIERELATTIRRNSPEYLAANREREAQRRARQRELHRLQQARWAKANPDCIAASMDKWEAKNPDYFRQHDRDRYAADPEKFKAKSRAYYAANRERINARRRRKKLA